MGRAVVGVVVFLLCALPSIAVVDTWPVVNGSVVTIAFEGTPPFTVNIRDDTFIGDVGGFIWATTDKNYIQVNLSLIDNPSQRFFYGVQDEHNWSFLKTFDMNPVPKQETAHDAVDVSVDFSQTQAVKSMVGFNRGMYNMPYDAAMDLIQPALVRDSYPYYLDQEFYDKVVELGAIKMIDLSAWAHDDYGADYWTPPPNPNAPYENFTKYDEYIREIASDTRDLDLIYEHWNEPHCNNNWPHTGCPPGENGTYFWGIEDQYFETFKHMHDVVRDELGPDVEIAAPSYGSYVMGRDSLARFLHFALENNLRIDVLVWHELRSRPESEFPQMQADLEYMREQYLENPKYAALGIEKIMINEIVGESVHMRPGSNLAQMRYLEDGGADAAGRTCWDGSESNGEKHCRRSTLAGLLTFDTKIPRGVWWAYKWYADSVSDRVMSTSSHHKIAPFASASTNNTNEAQVLLAFSAYELQLWVDEQDPQYWMDLLGLEEPPAPEDVIPYAPNFSTTNVSLTLQNLDSIPFLDNPQEIGVAIYRIPFNLSNFTAGEEDPLTAPVFVEEHSLPVTNGEATLLVENIGLYEVWQVKILNYIPSEANVTVDFSNPTGDPDHSMLGFNHGIRVDVTPEEYLDQIEIGYYRDGTPMWWSSDLASYMLDRNPDSKVNLFGSPGGYTPWWNSQEHGTSSRPFDPWFEDPQNTGIYNWTSYDAYLTEWANDFNSNPSWVQASAEGRFVVNIWNEPQNNPHPFVPHGNGKGGFNGTEQQWFDTFKHVHDFLKAQIPEIKFCAPTYGTDASFNTNFSNFMEFTKAEGLDIYAICLHSVANVPAAFEERAATIPEYRALYVNAEYGVQEIHVDENLGSETYLFPANMLGWLEWNERAGVDYAGQNTGAEAFNGGLGGLLNVSTWEPRPIFWVAKAYSDMLNGRREYASVYHAIPGFASFNGTAGLVMFGNYERPNDEVDDVNVTLKLERMDTIGAPPYTITLTRTDYGSDGVHQQLAPIPVDQFVTSNTDELFEVTIREHDVYFITVTPS